MASKPWERDYSGSQQATSPKPWERDYSGSSVIIDDESGAPFLDRFIIGSASSNDDKLARAKALYGDKAMADADGRISFEKDGQRAYVNPSGLDLGDVAGSAREIAATAATVPFDMSMVGIPAAAAVGATVSQGADALAAWLARNKANQSGNEQPQVQPAAEAGKEFATEAGLGLLGGYVGKGIGAGLGKVINPTDARLVQAWRDLGMNPPSLAAVSKGKGAARVEAAVGDTLTGSPFIESGARKARQGLDTALADVAERVAGPMVPKTPDGLGRLALQLAQDSKKAWQATTRQVEDDLFNEFGQNPAGMQNVANWINAEAAKLSPSAAESFRQRIGKALQDEIVDASSGGLNVNTLRALRTKLNQMAGDNALVTSMGVDKGVFKKLSSIAKDDIKAALKPDQLAKFEKYNSEYATQKEMRDILESALFGSGDTTKIGQALMSPNMSAQTARALKSILGDDQFNALRGGIIRQLGSGRAGAHFSAGEASPASFSTVTGTGKGAYQPEVQDLLFGGDLDAVRTVADGLSNAGKVFNTSRTASIAELMRLMRSPAQWGQGIGAALDPLTSLAVPAGLGFIHTSPTAINALSSPAARAIGNGVQAVGPRAGLMGGLSFGFNE